MFNLKSPVSKASIIKLYEMMMKVIFVLNPSLVRSVLAFFANLEDAAGIRERRGGKAGAESHRLVL